jgi:hypothetical protein
MNSEERQKAIKEQLDHFLLEIKTQAEFEYDNHLSVEKSGIIESLPAAPKEVIELITTIINPLMKFSFVKGAEFGYIKNLENTLENLK